MDAMASYFGHLTTFSRLSMTGCGYQPSLMRSHDRRKRRYSGQRSW